MNDAFASGDAKQRKSDGVADAINRLLQNLVIKCAKEEGVRDYFHVGMIGYGAAVGPAFIGPLAGRDLVPVSEIADNPARIDTRMRKIPDGAGGLIEQSFRFPIWFDAIANGGTPMCDALSRAASMAQSWCAQRPDNFPPVVINLTDGEATDGDPTGPGESVKAVQTSDGGALLFNLHISALPGAPIEYPDSEGGLPDEFARRLFRMSSPLPPLFRDGAREAGYRVTESSRGFAFNANLVSIITFLDIGTKPSNLLLAAR